MTRRAAATATCSARLLRTSRSESRTAYASTLRLAIIGLTALLDGLWLEWCLDPGQIPTEGGGDALRDWVDRLIAPRTGP